MAVIDRSLVLKSIEGRPAGLRPKGLPVWSFSSWSLGAYDESLGLGDFSAKVPGFAPLPLRPTYTLNPNDPHHPSGWRAFGSVVPASARLRALPSSFGALGQVATDIISQVESFILSPTGLLIAGGSLALYFLVLKKD